ncbi:hypothetical protein FGB62_17g07 [Gracilaria domingensis]|nr:hypothetical protein FGB62_17g07 [Gracilaria domingensis]
MRRHLIIPSGSCVAQHAASLSYTGVRSMTNSEQNQHFINALRVLCHVIGIEFRTTSLSDSRSRNERGESHEGTLLHIRDAFESFLQGDTVETLSRRRHRDLESFCEEHSISIVGNRLELAKRILDRFEETDILCALDNTLFRKPNRASAAAASGSFNEENVLRSLLYAFSSGFADKISCAANGSQSLCGIVRRRLVQSKTEARLLTSPDAIAVLKTELRTELIVVEVKTHHGEALLKSECLGSELLPTRYLKVQIDIRDLQEDSVQERNVKVPNAESNIENFKKFVPSVQDRVQLLHHATVYGLQRLFYAVSGPNELLYVLDLHLNDQGTTSTALRVVINSVLDHGGKDLFNAEIRLPDKVEERSYFQSRQSRRMHVLLARRAMEQALQTYEPLPEAKYIRPAAVCAWNEIGKTGTDTFSRQAAEIFPNRVRTAGGISEVAHQQYAVLFVNSLYCWTLLDTLSHISQEGSHDLKSRLIKTEFYNVRRLMSRRMGMRSFSKHVLKDYGLPNPSKRSFPVHRHIRIRPITVPDKSTLGPSVASERLGHIPTRQTALKLFNTERGWKLRTSGEHVPVIFELLRGAAKKGKSCWLCVPNGVPGEEMQIDQSRGRPKTVCIRCYGVYLCTSRRFVRKEDGSVSLAARSCFDYFHTARRLQKRFCLLLNPRSNRKSSGTTESNSTMDGNVLQNNNVCVDDERSQHDQSQSHRVRAVEEHRKRLRPRKKRKEN